MAYPTDLRKNAMDTHHNMLVDKRLREEAEAKRRKEQQRELEELLWEEQERKGK